MARSKADIDKIVSNSFNNKKKDANKRKNDSETVDSRSQSYIDKVVATSFVKGSVNFDTLQTDLNSLTTTINNVYTGWQTPEAMKNTRVSVQNMYNRLGKYQEYQKQYGGVDLSELYNTYGTVLKDWDALAEVYGQYNSADEYNKARELSGMTSSDVKVVLNETADLETKLKTAKEYENRIKGLNNRKRTWDHRAPGLNVGGVDKELKQVETEYKNYLDSIGFSSSADIEKALSGRKIAFTTTGGQNIMWQDLYDTKKQKEDSDALYKDISSKKDFAWNKNVGATLNNSSDKDANVVEYAVANKEMILMAELNGHSNGNLLYYTHATQEEREIYSYWLGSETTGTAPEGSAKKYLDSLLPSLKKRNDQAMLEGTIRLAEEHPIIASGLSVGASLFASAEALKNGVEYLQTGEMKKSTGAEAVTAIRGTVSQNYDWMLGDWDAFDFVYNSGMSMADSAVASSIFGGGGGVALGLSAAAQGTNDALDRGLDSKSAFWSGLSAGVFEGLFETISIGKFKALKEAPVDGVKSIIKNVGKSMLVNASEEALTELANLTYDYFVNADMSQFKTQVRAYMNSGMSKEEATRKVALEQAAQVGEAGLSGAFMGIGFGGFGGTSAYLNTKHIGSNIKANSRTGEVFDLASVSPEASSAYEAYTRYANKGVSADNANDAQAGSLWMQSMMDAQSVLDSKESTAEQKAMAQKTIAELETYAQKNPSAKVGKKDIRKMYGKDAESVEALINEGLESGEETLSYKLATEYKSKIENGEKLSTNEISKLVEANETAFKSETEGGIAERITELGESSDIADIVTRKVRGEEITLNEAEKLNANENALQVLGENINEELVDYVKTMGDDVDANLFISLYDGKTDLEAYATSFNLVTEYAKNDYTYDTILKNKGVLTNAQAAKIYKETRIKADTDKQNKINKLNEEMSKKMAYKGFVDDSIIEYDGTSNKKTNAPTNIETETKGESGAKRKQASQTPVATEKSSETEKTDKVVAKNTTTTEEKLTKVKAKTETETKAKETDSTTESASDSETKSYVSGNDGKKDGAVIDEIGNDSTVKAIERDKTDVSKAMSGVAGQTIEMDKPVEIIYVPNSNGKSIFAMYFAQTKDRRGGQIASINSVGGNASFDRVYGMEFMNETGFMDTVNKKGEADTTQIRKTEFKGNIEAVKQILNQIYESVTANGIRGQITFTMDDIDVNNFNEVSCALFSEVSKYLPESIKSKLGFKSQSFGSIPRYVRFAGVNSSVATKNAINIDHVEKATGKFIDKINELLEMNDAQRENAINDMFATRKNILYSDGENRTYKTNTEKVKWSDLKPRQRQAITFVKGLAQATGMNLVLTANEKYNGAYTIKDNTIYLDVYAGIDHIENLTDTIIPTMSHELTHWMEHKAPELWRKINEVVFSTLQKADDLTETERIANEIERQKVRFKRNLTEQDARSEIIARACEDMLSKSETAKQMFNSLTETERKTLVDKIKDIIQNIKTWVNDLLSSYKSTSYEAKALREFEDELNRLSELWDKMLSEAVVANQSLEKSGAFKHETSVEGDVKLRERDLANIGLQIDTESDSIAPNVLFSERTWTESEYVKDRETAINAIVKALDVSKKDAERYVDNINSISRMIADDRTRLDYEQNVDESASVLKTNKEYKWTVDMSTLCAKRLLFTGTFDAIQKKLPNTIFNSEDIVALRSMMMKRGYEVACGICYVESTRRELGPITADFIERYKLAQKNGTPISKINSSGNEVVLTETGTGRNFYAEDGYVPTLAELNTTDIDLVKRDHPEVYGAYLSFMKSRGQAIPKLLETRTEYKGEILKHFKAKSAVKSRNDAGGLRVQSFSDFEVAHLIDMMQIVLDMSRVGLMSQAYTKVPAFADVFGNTGMKINLSLIAKDSGLDENGNLIFDDVEGMPHKEAFRLRNKYSKNVGTILVGKNDAHIRAALADPRIDFIIPFHKSFWKESLYDALGLTGYDDYTETQNEKPFDKNRKIKNFQPSEYWDYSKSGEENAKTYLKMCAEDGRIPKFPQFQNCEGYWKLLIDFKMYDNDGVGSPQMTVQPDFSMDEANAIMNSYEGGHRSFPVAQDVVDDFTKQYEGRNDIMYSVRVTELTEDDYNNVKNHFGVTNDFNVAGYLLLDGKMLDFSGKHWGDTRSTFRQVDHRDIQEAIPSEDNGRDSMVNMISNGNIRLMPETGGINLAIAPTKNQRVILRRYIGYMSPKEGIIVDIDEVGGDTIKSFTYDVGVSADKVMRDIDNYFRGGTQSELMRFHTAEGDGVLYSDRVTDEETLDFLNNQKTLKVYRAMQVIDGKLYPPMAAKVRSEDGKKELVYSSEIGVWEQATEHPELIKNGKFELDKANGSSIYAAYNPYIHTSASPLNDQFSSAYKRENLVTVEGEIPISELTSGYHAEFAKDSVGETKWHSGPVASKLKGDKARKVYLSRWFKPTRIVPDSEVASIVAKTLEGETISVPYKVVTPSLREELEKKGVSILYSDREDTSVYDLMGENERLLKENEKFKAEVERLNERLKIEKKVTKGNFFNENQLGSVAGHLRNISKSLIAKDKLVEQLKGVYSFIAHSPELTWEEVFERCYNIADAMLEEAKPEIFVDDYSKRILNEIRTTKISLDKEQKKEAEYIFGKNWNRHFFNRVGISDNGIPIDMQWQEWSSLYPDIFEPGISDGDMIGELDNIINTLKDASETVMEYNEEEQKRWLAREIYNQYWNVSPIRTTADKYDRQIRRLNFEHRRIMTEFREEYNSRMKDKLKAEKDSMEEKQKKLVAKIRERKEKEIAVAKERGKEKLNQYKENAERKTRIQSITSNALSLNEMLVKNSKDKHIPEVMKDTVVELLQAINFSSKRLLEKGVPTNKDMRLANALRNLNTEFLGQKAGIKESLDDFYASEIDQKTSELVKSVDEIMKTIGDNEFILNKMSAKDLKNLDEVIKIVKSAVNRVNKFHVAQHNAGVESLAIQSTQELKSRKKVYGDNKKHFDKLKTKTYWNNLNPFYAFKNLGEGAQIMFRAFQDGQDKIAFLSKEVIDFAESVYTDKEYKTWSKTFFDFEVMQTNGETKKFSLNVPQIMSLYCVAKQEDAKRHLLHGNEKGNGGGITIVETDKTEAVRNNIMLTEADLNRIISALDDKTKVGNAKAVADKLQEFMGTRGAELGNEISMARWGIKSFGIKDYFPIKVSDGAVPEKGETPGVQGNPLISLLNMSFTHSRNEFASQSIEIGDMFDVFASHMSSMIQYNAMALPVLDMYKWMNCHGTNEDGAEFSVKTSVKDTFGDYAWGYLNTFMKDVNGTTKDITRDNLGLKFFRNAKVAKVAFNIRVVALQFTSYMRAGAVLDNKYLLKALMHTPKIKKTEQYCGMALLKSLGYYDTDITKPLTDKIKHVTSAKEKLIDWSLKGAEVADKVTLGYLWNACELEVRQTRKDLRVGSAEFYKEIGIRLRDVIYRTQVVDSQLTRSQMMRGSTWDKTLTSFASENALSFNLITDIYVSKTLDERSLGKKEAWKKNGKYMRKAITAYVVTNLVTAAIATMFDAFRDYDEEEKDEGYIAKLMIENFINNISFANKIPYINLIISALSGFSASRMETDWMEDSTKALKEISKIVSGTENGDVEDLLKYALKAFSNFTGIAGYNVYRDIQAVYEMLND